MGNRKAVEKPSAPVINKGEFEKILKAANRLPSDRKRELLDRIEQMIKNPEAASDLGAVVAPLGPQASILAENFGQWLKSATQLPAAEQASLHRRIQYMMDTHPLSHMPSNTSVPRRNNKAVYFDRLVRGAVKLPDGWKLILRDSLKAELETSAN